MNKTTDVKLLFRTINKGLNEIEELPVAERRRTLDALKEINERLCDYVIDLVEHVNKKTK